MKPEIEKCACGKIPFVQDDGYMYYIVCPGGQYGGQTCWRGTHQKTKRGAILAWNRVMRAQRALAEIAKIVEAVDKRRAKAWLVYVMNADLARIRELAQGASPKAKKAREK